MPIIQWLIELDELCGVALKTIIRGDNSFVVAIKHIKRFADPFQLESIPKIQSTAES